jgi:hypothetical protein
VRSYLADRTAYFVFDNQKSSSFKIIAEVPQGSPFSPVLFLLYIAILYENLQIAHSQLIIIGFANNTNLLAVSGIFEANKDLLKAAWKTCERWFQKTGMEFASEKNKLLHFNNAKTACELFLRLKTVIIQPITNAKFLKVWLNNKLFWKNHLTKVKKKMVTQMLAFSKLATFA